MCRYALKDDTENSFSIFFKKYCIFYAFLKFV
jgi:hypothetical protein